MFIKNLPNQIQALIDHYCAGSQMAFAKKIGVPQSTLHRNMAKADEKNLLKVLPKILLACPEVRESWLYTGEGEMLGRPRPGGVRCAENSKRLLVGDLLWDAIGYAQLDENTVREAAGVDAAEWEAVLASNEYPSFKMLEALYNQFGLNVEYLFSDRGATPWLPLSAIQMIDFLVGRKSAYPPPYNTLEEWFGCTKEEAREYLARYKLWLNKVHAIGFKHEEESEDEEETGRGEPVLPHAWVEYFCSHTKVEWLPGRHPLQGGCLQVLRHSPEEENKRLKQELAELRSSMEAAREKIIQLQDQIIELQNSLKILEGDVPMPKSVLGEMPGENQG